MPESRHYVVTETRTIEVNAESPVDAARIGAAALAGDFKPDGVWGSAHGEPRTVSLAVDDDRSLRVHL